MKIKFLMCVAVLATAIFCLAYGGIIRAAAPQTAADCLSVVGGSNYSTAEQISCLQNLIAQLTAQLKALQVQQGATTAAWCYTFNTNLGFAQSGTNDIAQLHTALQQQGITYGSDTSTTYAEDTAAAVVQFQGKYGIKQSGYVGPITRAKLNELYGCTTTQAPVPPVCNPNWTCGWGPCTNGSQSQAITDSNNCGVSSFGASIACPALTQTCNVSTQPSIVSLGTNNALPGEKVAIYLSSIPSANYYSVIFAGNTVVGPVAATLSSDGTYLGFTVPPANFPSGSYTLTVNGNNPDGSLAFKTQNSVPFTIGIASTQPPTTTQPPQNSLVAYYKLDGDVTDSSGNGNNGTIVGGVSCNITGKVGQACNFDGTDSISIPSSVMPTQQYTISAWVKIDEAAKTEVWRNWIMKPDFETTPVEIGVGDGRSTGGASGPMFLVWNNSAGVVNLENNSFNLRDGSWHQMAATYKPGEQDVYVDGQLAGTSYYTGTLPATNSPIYIGGGKLGAYHMPWVGGIDEVRIYNYVLPFSQIQQIYATAGGTTSTPVNGVCGSANGVATSSAPTTNLCLTGTTIGVASNATVAGTAPTSWSWTCTGSNGGTSAYCSTPSATAAPSITVTSPNGGEKYVVGSNMIISWSNTNYRNSVVNIFLYQGQQSGDYNYVAQIGNLGQVNNGMTTWTIPSTIPPGNNYFIRIGLDVQDPQTGMDTFDDSNAPFSITAPVTISLNTPSLVMSSTTPAQFIAAGNSGATNASQATYNFTANGWPVMITELKFGIAGSESSPSPTVSNICVGSVCSQPVNGVADLTGLQLTVPTGYAGLNQPVLVSYAPVGSGGVPSGAVAAIVLNYVKYTISYGISQTITPSISAPTMTLVGSMPTLTVNQMSPSSGLVPGTNNQIGQVTVAANSKGSIKINKITFNFATSGFSGSPTISGPKFGLYDNSAMPIAGSSCSVSGATIVCTLGSGFATDYSIAAGQSQVFNLLATINGSANAGATASIATSLTTTGFIWDDTSSNGSTNSVGLTGYLIYNFPTNSYITTYTGGSTTAINGACGSSNGQTLSSAPTTNLCSTGIVSSVSGSGPWTWTCPGSNGGTTASCSALATSLLTQVLQLQAQASTACTQGQTIPQIPANATSSDLQTLVLQLQITILNCQSATTPVNGACGSANGTTVSSAPTTNLCSTGITSSVSGSGPWTWTCVGSNGGTSASCSASIASAAGFNTLQNSLASISDAVAQIEAEIQAMLKK